MDMNGNGSGPLLSVDETYSNTVVIDANNAEEQSEKEMRLQLRRMSARLKRKRTRCLIKVLKQKEEKLTREHEALAKRNEEMRQQLMLLLLERDTKRTRHAPVRTTTTTQNHQQPSLTLSQPAPSTACSPPEVTLSSVASTIFGQQLAAANALLHSKRVQVVEFHLGQGQDQSASQRLGTWYDVR